MTLVWLFAGTLAAAMARQGSTDASVPGTDLALAWSIFRESLRRAEVPAEQQIVFDLMEERGDLPPGWVVHPTLGLMQLYEPVIHLVNDGDTVKVFEEAKDSSSRTDDRPMNPIRIFVHSQPETGRYFPEDTIDYYAIKFVQERAEAIRDDYDYPLSQPWLVDEESLIESLWERESEPARSDAYTREWDVVMAPGDPGRVLFNVFADTLRERVQPPEAYLSRLIEARADEVVLDDLVWAPFVVDEGFDETLQDLLEEEGIFVAEGTMHIEALDDANILTDFDDSDAALLALKHGFVLAQIPDEIGSPYWRMYVIHPTPPSPILGTAPDDEEWREANEQARRHLQHWPTIPAGGS